MSPIIWSVTFLFVKYSSSFVLILVAFFMGYKKLFVLGIFRVPACPFVYAPLDRYHENVKLLIVFLMGTAVCIARKKRMMRTADQRYVIEGMPIELPIHYVVW